ncbi:hypothetical protein A2U01_0103873, partial [Trifolium medium]|nr:hypothetical protein [Trifolium medium]
MKEGFEAQISDLTRKLKESRALASNECRLREETERLLQNLPADWRELLRELKDREQRQRQDYEALR